MTKSKDSNFEGQEMKKESQGMGPVRIIPLTSMRKTIIKRLSNSEKNTLRVTMTMEVDMSKAIRLRETINQEERNVRISYTDMIVKATIDTLKQNLILNSKLEGEKILIFEKIHMGVAVALESGLIVPVIRNADSLSLVEIARSMKKLIEKAKKRKLSLSEVTGGTFTITNLGQFGVDIFTPIINPPQSAILGMHKIEKRPVVENDQIVVRPVMYLALSYDHRIIDGRESVTFLRSIKEGLEDPARLLLGL